MRQRPSTPCTPVKYQHVLAARQGRQRGDTGGQVGPGEWRQLRVEAVCVENELGTDYGKFVEAESMGRRRVGNGESRGVAVEGTLGRLVGGLLW